MGEILCILFCSWSRSCDIIILLVNMIQGYSCVHLTCIAPNGNKPPVLESVSLPLGLSLVPVMEDIKGSLRSV